MFSHCCVLILGTFRHTRHLQTSGSWERTQFCLFSTFHRFPVPNGIQTNLGRRLQDTPDTPCLAEEQKPKGRCQADAVSDQLLAGWSNVHYIRFLASGERVFKLNEEFVCCILRDYPLHSPRKDQCFLKIQLFRDIFKLTKTGVRLTHFKCMANDCPKSCGNAAAHDWGRLGAKGREVGRASECFTCLEEKKYVSWPGCLETPTGGFWAPVVTRQHLARRVLVCMMQHPLLNYTTIEGCDQ